MIDVSMEEVRSAVSGTWLQRPGTERIAGVGTDTRADLDGRAFVALRGERFDAHDHLDAAAAAGASPGRGASSGGGGPGGRASRPSRAATGSLASDAHAASRAAAPTSRCSCSARTSAGSPWRRGWSASSAQAVNHSTSRARPSSALR